MDVATLQSLGSGYVPVMVFVCLLALARASREAYSGQGVFADPVKRFALFRAVTAIMIVHVSQHVIAAFQDDPLTWWQNLGLDFLAFMCVTAPPRYTAQAIIGACFGVMIILDVLWAFVPEIWFGRVHYLGSTVAGYIAFFTLFFWTVGGGRARMGMGRFGRWLSRVLLFSLGKKPT